ncbi:AMP-binding domain containing protein [Asbolus verrucosus]|uniref:AMP-binding domain containing protein n=1 Tax=Asbolus verrucosus TaxID=1661398 RepID=A0A482VNZ5_ASBVE|nr:AMP-binding domain containing protein [Asbolus verrucosus]
MYLDICNFLLRMQLDDCLRFDIKIIHQLYGMTETTGRGTPKNGLYRVKSCEILDAGGFLHTEDVRYYGDDGFIYIAGRIKEMITCKGHQVIRVITDVAVIAKPDKRAGEVAAGFIFQFVKAIPRSNSEKILRKELEKKFE